MNLKDSVESHGTLLQQMIIDDVNVVTLSTFVSCILNPEAIKWRNPYQNYFCAIGLSLSLKRKSCLEILAKLFDEKYVIEAKNDVIINDWLFDIYDVPSDDIAAQGRFLAEIVKDNSISIEVENIIRKRLHPWAVKYTGDEDLREWFPQIMALSLVDPKVQADFLIDVIESPSNNKDLFEIVQKHITAEAFECFENEEDCLELAYWIHRFPSSTTATAQDYVEFIWNIFQESSVHIINCFERILDPEIKVDVNKLLFKNIDFDGTKSHGCRLPNSASSHFLRKSYPSDDQSGACINLGIDSGCVSWKMSIKRADYNKGVACGVTTWPISKWHTSAKCTSTVECYRGQIKCKGKGQRGKDVEQILVYDVMEFKLDMNKGIFILCINFSKYCIFSQRV
eukprot:TRINITY_DN5820_c0_g1_i3.p1 TRINITY_DN5820_c0_g1~~TRINITY_DN5820_c0_g1_i3.p1  ORF type:complete len:396 (+),score=76.66 TRINITY_DN5820_c0_g1_i3:187-1374(+)